MMNDGAPAMVLVAATTPLATAATAATGIDIKIVSILDEKPNVVIAVSVIKAPT